MWHGGKWGEVSPTFDQFDGMKKGENGENPKIKGREKSNRGEKRKRGRKEKEKFPGFLIVEA